MQCVGSDEVEDNQGVIRSVRYGGGSRPARTFPCVTGLTDRPTAE
jgi:hypothetical protein